MKLRQLAFLIMALFIFCGFSLFSRNKADSKKEDAQKVEETKKTIAMVPIQKAMPGPLYLSTQPGLLSTVTRMFKEKELSLRSKVDYDPKFVPETLNRFLANEILGKDYLVYLPDQVDPFFEELRESEKEFTIEQLNKSFNADAFFILMITEWFADEYDRSGTFKVSFEASLIDAKTNRSVWSNKAVDLRMKTSSNDFLYSKYQKDVLNELASKILKGFPKKQWEV